MIFDRLALIYHAPYILKCLANFFRYGWIFFPSHGSCSLSVLSRVSHSLFNTRIYLRAYVYCSSVCARTRPLSLRAYAFLYWSVCLPVTFILIYEKKNAKATVDATPLIECARVTSLCRQTSQEKLHSRSRKAS